LGYVEGEERLAEIVHGDLISVGLDRRATAKIRQDAIEMVLFGFGVLAGDFGVSLRHDGAIPCISGGMSGDDKEDARARVGGQ
jgi:hypothetical protein